jgi:hypothetical protein
MRILVLVPICRRPQASGHHGTQLARSFVIISYFAKVNGIVGANQHDY